MSDSESEAMGGQAVTKGQAVMMEVLREERRVVIVRKIVM